MLNSTLINLFDGSCGDAFGQELGYTHYVVYNYEDNSSPPWVAWDGSAPVLTIEESFCGRHSLYVSYYNYMCVHGSLICWFPVVLVMGHNKHCNCTNPKWLREQWEFLSFLHWLIYQQ